MRIRRQGAKAQSRTEIDWVTLTAGIERLSAGFLGPLFDFLRAFAPSRQVFFLQ
jgi:hypothetical protein